MKVFQFVSLPLRVCLSILASGVTVLFVGADAGAHDKIERLFLPVAPDRPAVGAGRARGDAMKSLNLSSILRLVTDHSTNRIRLTVSLAQNEDCEVTIDKREWLEARRVVCRGSVREQPGSYFMLAISGEAVAGSLFIPGRGMFQFQYSGHGVQRIVEADSSLLPACGQKPGRHIAVEEPEVQNLVFQAAGAPSTPTNTVVDLLVVYTADARDGAGGTDGMNALIDAAVAEANLAFENSEVLATLRLVHRAEINYRESGSINDDLDRLEDDDDDSSLAIVHQLRGAHRADVVCMITERTGGPFGLANQMREVEKDFGKKAFSIIKRQYAISYQALAHEIGHNMGCQHDRATSPTGGAYDYSHAYRFEVDDLVYHTVMAYQPGLPIPYFSNPDVLFIGEPTGIEGASTNSADNARTLNRTVATVARFDSVIRAGLPPQVTLLSPTNGAVFPLPAVVEISGDATDPDGQVEVVEFYVNGVKIGSRTSPPYTMLWTNTVPGTYSFRMEAKDDSGWEVDSSRAIITLVNSGPFIDLMESDRRPDGVFQVRVRGVDGEPFRLECSENLTSWSLLTTDSLIGDFFDYEDSAATNSPVRFYRVLPVP